MLAKVDKGDIDAGKHIMDPHNWFMDLTIKFPTYIENSIQVKGMKGDWFLL